MAKTMEYFSSRVPCLHAPRRYLVRASMAPYDVFSSYNAGMLYPPHAFCFGSAARLIACVVLLSLAACQSRSAYGQAGLRESLERLDKNLDGSIEPSEITPLARPYFERLAREGAVRLDLNRKYKISKLQEYARRYFAKRNGSAGGRIEIEGDGDATVLPFGTRPGEPLVPEFGIAGMKFRYTQDDLDSVERTMRSNDKNKDGFVDRDEASRGKWTYKDPFTEDLNNDGRLSRMELAQRYARRRLLEQSANELRQRAERKGGLPDKDEEKKGADQSSSTWWREGGTDYWLTAALFTRFDDDGNKTLSQRESEKMGIPIGLTDLDRDGEVTRDELFAYIKVKQDEAGGSATAAPEWFTVADVNNDGQVAMSEFSSDWTVDKLAEFSSYDANDDGLLTIAEANRPQGTPRGTYRNDVAEQLPPNRVVVSEIEVIDDAVIGDLDVQMSLSHSSTSMIDGYLVSPNGQRIELFAGIGGSGDSFNDTIFDDEADQSVERAGSPYAGRFKPQGISKGQPGLAEYRGSSAKGIWQLVIRGSRSSRFGILHGWSLLIESQANASPTKTAELPEGE